MKFFNKEQMDVISNRKVIYIIAAVIIAVGVAFMFINGFNLDTDFAGGITLQYDLHKTLDKAELDNIRDLVNSVDGITVSTIQKSGDDSNCVIIKAGDTTPEVVAEVYNVLNIAYGAKLEEEKEDTEENTETEETTEQTDTKTEETAEPETEEEEIVYGGTTPVEVLSESRIGASISNEIKRSAVIATVIAVILMLVYITVRFEFRSALAAICCLAFDITVVISSYAILQIPVSSNTIAVLLTILGYSINATIIIFDRVRENRKKMGRTHISQIMNMSIRQTLNRSVFTTITTLLTIGAIYVLGVHSIKEFSLPIIVGLVSGLFSSVFLSCSFWYTFSKKSVK
ncbi:MAG: protein translocase subunit SecF [Ruminococcaceae bacterium]|nr:protein translocase subunit SecF [Oscillospiraceae bacterium]